MMRFSAFGLPLLLIFTSCQEKDTQLVEPESALSVAINKAETICNTTELTWLQEIVERAEEDKQSQVHQGNFTGRIYQGTYQNDYVIFVRMAMGSGGLYGYFYRCDGSQINFSKDNPDEVEAFLQSIEEGSLIYTNLPHD
ncbi:hypothetical protein [Tunicatimonas pelagia]|uniref:hypothetical protein n=1 Tax=Tunicatimonas pelagia TaxID=931531 RepID=UPI002666E050|nr:hypothetical protein [Tunicatimonas pelagia]WKN46269.1 hypothetical protein P0M28_15055 [Tunicatimonas pelagia]